MTLDQWNSLKIGDKIKEPSGSLHALQIVDFKPNMAICILVASEVNKKERNALTEFEMSKKTILKYYEPVYIVEGFEV